MTEAAPEIKDAVSVTRNRRTDAMFVCALGMVIWLVYIVVYEPKINEYAQGVITLVLGAFIGFLTAMFNFEVGTTRGGQNKDAAIARIAEQSAPTSAAAAAASAATNVAATAAAAGTPPIPVVPVVPAAQPPGGTP